MLGVSWTRRFSPQVLEDGLEKLRQIGDNSAPWAGADFILIDFGSLVTTRSDAEGRFSLHGLPVGSLSQFMYVKPGFVTKATKVALLPGFDSQGTARHHLTAGILNDAYLKRNAQLANESIEQTRQRFLQRGDVREYEGASLRLTMKKGVSLEGTVRNLKGEPVAGMTVFSGGHQGHAITDQQGNYRLEDVSPASDYTVQAQSHERYLVAQASALHRDSGPIRIDVQVRPGAILRGKVIDGKTGQGVRSYVQARPTPGNPLLNKPNVLHECSTNTEPDGTFRLVAPPGDIIVSASPDAGIKVTEPMSYVPASILPSHQGLLQQRGETGSVTFRDSTMSYQLNYAYQLLELPAEGETSVELTLSRGKERTLHLVDPQGRPIESALIAGLDQTEQPFAVKQGQLQIVGITSTQRYRHLFVIDKERKLGAYLAMLTSETEPLTMKLEPLGSLSSRVLDNQSKPIGQIRLAVRPQPRDSSRDSHIIRSEWNPQMLEMLFPSVTTDEDGRFTLENIIPNMDYVVYSTDHNRGSSNLLNKTRQIKPGEKQTWTEMRMRPVFNR